MITTVTLKEFAAQPAAVLEPLRDAPLGPARRWSSLAKASERVSDLVAISRYGRVVATLRPVTPAELTSWGLKLTDESFVSSSDFHSVGPARFVKRAENGEQLVVTYRSEPIGILGPASDLEHVLPPLSSPPEFDDGARYVSGDDLELSDLDLKASDTDDGDERVALEQARAW